MDVLTPHIGRMGHYNHSVLPLPLLAAAALLGYQEPDWAPGNGWEQSEVF